MRSSSAAPAVAHLEAHRTADLDHVAGGEGPRLGVGADHPADQEVAALVLLGVLVHRDADQQPALDHRALFVRELGHDLLELGQRGGARQLVQDVVLGLGDGHRRADRPGALADQRRGHDRTAEQHADRARVDDLAVGEEPRGAAPALAGGQAADDRQARQDLTGPLDEGVHREAVGVGEQDGDDVVVPGLGHADHGEALCAVRLFAGELQGLQPERLDARLGQPRRPRADRAGVLDAVVAADHAGSAAADHVGSAG